ncbi:putative phage abortive infection protein [Flavobacterium sp. DSP2-3-1]|uniref:putative phage abortive infection protein n=1 Tax=Flavobacterium sp. DSP2-3-1 TaxID=2804620 RepID=UPI003CF2FCEC
MNTYNILLTCILIIFVFLLLSMLSFKNIFDNYFKSEKKNYLIKPLVVIGVALIVISFVSPYFYTGTNIGDQITFTAKTGYTGDTLGGIMNPFIALAGAVLTFIAFYIQKIANDDIKNQFKTQQFENQFYERLKLIKEEINTIYLPLTNGNTLSGRKVFYELDKEIKFIYFIVSNLLKNFDNSVIFHITYQIFYKGRKDFFSDKHLIYVSEKYNIRKIDLLELDEIFTSVYKYFVNLSDDYSIHKSIPVEINEEAIDLERVVSEYLEKLDNVKYKELFEDLLNDDANYHYSYLIFKDKYDIKFNHVPFKGMETKVSLILRQLFSLVKFVTNYSTVDYKEKRSYLRVLRSILSNYEQLHIFYNWYSGNGSPWEDGKNRFLTDYRMIHNLPPNFLIEGFDLESIFSDRNFEYEEGRKLEDSLFEQIDIFSTKS